VQVDPDTQAATLFAPIDATLPKTCPGGIGLTTALVALQSAWVIVGSLPTNAGTLEPGASGCLLVLDKFGTVQEVLSGDGINGPWDMTALDNGSDVKLFVTNVLNGTLDASPNVVTKAPSCVSTGTSRGTSPRSHGHDGDRIGVR